MDLPKKNPVLLMVDDDDEDIYLTRRAFREHREDLIFRSVQNGAELFDYLNCTGDYENNSPADMPDIILLDINIPKENGFDILKRLKEDGQHGHLPVTMLTTSSATHDVCKAYKLGASSFICKSITANGMKEVAHQFCEYWFNFAKLPTAC